MKQLISWLFQFKICSYRSLSKLSQEMAEANYSGFHRN